MNFLTYHQQPDGRLLVGIDYEHERFGWAFNQFWFSCHIKPNWYLMDFLSLFPETAPKDENHILSATGFITDINYSNKNILFRALNEGKTVIKIAFKPSNVWIDKKRLSAKKWHFNKENNFIEINHNTGTIEIR